MSLITQPNEQYYEGPDGIWNSLDENYGDYQFISLKDIINNFMVSYVGDDKIISTVKKLDVIFHAKRAIQEFSYDISRVEKIQEIEVGDTLTVPFPQDYVKYVQLSGLMEME